VKVILEVVQSASIVTTLDPPLITIGCCTGNPLVQPILAIEFEDITARFVNPSEHLANIFSKSLRGPRIYHIWSKLNT